jgi:hypothetical protein
MCGLCGILTGEAHWADLSPLMPVDDRSWLRRQERQRRVIYLNRILRAFACSVSDWQGSKYQLSTFTGKTELAEDLAQLWAGVERLTGRRPDPLSEAVLERVSASA